MTGALGRRSVLTAAVAIAAAGAAGARTAGAQVQPVSIAAVLRPVFGDRPIGTGRVVLKLPVVAENGSSVQVGLGLEGTELPRRMVLMAPANPQPLAAEIRYGPRAARADVITRLRLARSQVIVAAAEMADGRIYATSAEVVITSGACVELGE